MIQSFTLYPHKYVVITEVEYHYIVYMSAINITFLTQVANIYDIMKSLECQS